MSDQNLDKALNLKKEGNESYKANNFEAAIAKYNEAIGKEDWLFYANCNPST